MSVPERRAMIERPGETLSVDRHCPLLNQARSGVYRPGPVTKRVHRLMRVMGIEALVSRPFTSKAAPGHKIHPYLLQGVSITGPITSGPATSRIFRWRLVFLYLVAIIDGATRAVLAWR